MSSISESTTSNEYWLIKDTGTKSYGEPYFAGWKVEREKSWVRSREDAKGFFTRGAAFQALKTFKGKAHIYAKRGARLRFVVVRVFRRMRNE